MGNDCCGDPDENLKWSAVLGQSVDEDLQSFATAIQLGLFGIASRTSVEVTG